MKPLPRGTREFLFAQACLLAISGCGPTFKIAKVTGKVTLDGRPVTQGKVLFRPENGPIAAGELGAGGEFTLTTYQPGDGAIVGNCAVAIAAPTYGAPMAGYQPPPPPPADEIIPTEYHNFTTSGLSRTVENADNVFDFELKSRDKDVEVPDEPEVIPSTETGPEPEDSQESEVSPEPQKPKTGEEPKTGSKADPVPELP